MNPRRTDRTKGQYPNIPALNISQPHIRTQAFQNEQDPEAANSECISQRIKKHWNNSLFCSRQSLVFQEVPQGTSKTITSVYHPCQGTRPHKGYHRNFLQWILTGSGQSNLNLDSKIDRLKNSKRLSVFDKDNLSKGKTYDKNRICQGFPGRSECR